METPKQVLPFEYKEPTYDIDGMFTDVLSYLLAVKKELENGPQVFVSRKRLQENRKRKREEGEEEEGEKSKDKKGDKQEESDFVKSFLEQKKKYNEEDDLEQEPISIPDNFTAWRAYMIETKPSKAIISKLNQNTILKLIIYMKKLIDNSLKGYLDQWVMALFLRLNDVLVYNDLHELREVGKRMVQLLKKESLSEQSRLLCQMIVNIVTEVYGQRDIKEV